MKGNQTKIVSITAIIVVIFISVFIGIKLGEQKNNIQPTQTAIKKAVDTNSSSKPNSVSIEAATVSSLTEEDKKQITDIQLQIADTWDAYNKEYLTFVLNSKNDITFDKAEILKAMYLKAKNDVAERYMEPKLLRLATELAETEKFTDLWSPLELYQNDEFNSIVNYDGDVRVLSVAQFISLGDDYKLVEEIRGSKYSEMSLNPLDINDKKFLDIAISNIHQFGYTQYAITIQEVRLSSVQFNISTSTNTETSYPGSNRKTENPNYILVTIYSKLNNTWYPINPNLYIKTTPQSQ